MLWKWKCTWITGASSGIGKALAETLAGMSKELILSGRSISRLHATAECCKRKGAFVRVLPFDISRSAERINAVRSLEKDGVQVDALVNNAGVSQRSLAKDTIIAVDNMLFEINYHSGVELTKMLLPQMIQEKQGCIIAVSSIAGIIPAVNRSTYNAAKASQIAFYGTLANEVSRYDVQVTTVIPGFVRTQVSQNSLTGSGNTYGILDSHLAKGIDAASAAQQIIKGVIRKKRRVYTGITMPVRAALCLQKTFPNVLDMILQKIHL